MMIKRLALAFIALTLLLPGCSALPDLSTFLQTPTSIPVNSPQPTATPFGLPASNTPDLFVINTEEPTTTPPTGTPEITFTPTQTFTPTTRPTITLEPIDPSLFTPSPNYFLSVQRSTSQIVWGSTCDGARSIKFVVQVTPSPKLKYVLLFIKLQDKYSAYSTDWGAGAILSDNDQGVYFYTIELNQIARYRTFEDAWLQYQFVALDRYRNAIGRSVVSRTEVSLTHCKVFNP
ncbi:MAG: hypothetical protein HXY35_11860 [Chloroflexi bacterium]|nr:hypothetical protein [Chloroflexota bacterium]